jgi:hypothetical protein
MKKDGSQLVAFAEVIGQSDVGINGGFVLCVPKPVVPENPIRRGRSR